MAVTVIIPAYNEAATIGEVVQDTLSLGYEVIVVDDGSNDRTADLASIAGERVVSEQNSGYIAAIKRGFRESNAEIVVTMDADGEHRPADIPSLIKPIAEGQADLVLGRRTHTARPSERFISSLSSLRVPIHDTGTGFREMRRSLALKMNLPGVCICGTSVLEARVLGARIAEIPITLGHTAKPRKIAWKHARQIFSVTRMLFK